MLPYMDKMKTDISSFCQTAQDIFCVGIPPSRSLKVNDKQVWRELNGFGVVGAKLIPTLRLQRLWRTADDEWTDLSHNTSGSQFRAQSFCETYRKNLLIVKFSSDMYIVLILEL